MVEVPGSTLTSAAEKLSQGAPATMTLAEISTWKRTKINLESIAPELSKLSDKAIAAKIMDRAWVQDAITKARQQAQMFDEISKRAESASKIKAATTQREILMDAVAALEDQLRAPRPVAKSSQGPKTRAAQRLNQLAPEDALIVTPQNRLAAP